METNNKVSSIERLATAFNQLQLKERRLIFFAVPALVVFVAIMSFIEPAFVDMNKSKSEIAMMQVKQAEIEATKQALFAEAAKDPNQKTKLNIEQIEKRLSTLESEFNAELSQLVPPQAMPVLLEELFEKANSLKLIKMESIPPTALFEEEASDKKLYQHGISITFEGSYLDTRDFLKKAEDLGWKLYWKFLKYEVETHPKAVTTLEVFTLSTSEAFISVY